MMTVAAKIENAFVFDMFATQVQQRITRVASCGYDVSNVSNVSCTTFTENCYWIEVTFFFFRPKKLLNNRHESSFQFFCVVFNFWNLCFRIFTVLTLT